MKDYYGCIYALTIFTNIFLRSTKRYLSQVLDPCVSPGFGTFLLFSELTAETFVIEKKFVPQTMNNLNSHLAKTVLVSLPVDALPFRNNDGLLYSTNCHKIMEQCIGKPSRAVLNRTV